MSANAERIRQRVLTSRVGIETYVTPTESLVAEDINGALRSALLESAGRGDTRIVADLSDVAQINSGGIEALLDAHDELLRLGGRLKIINASSLVFDILQLTGFARHVSTSAMEADEPSGPAPASGNRKAEPLGKILSGKGLLTGEQVEKALQIQRNAGQRFGDIIVDRGWVTQDQVLEALGEQLAVPLVRLRAGMFDPAVAEILGAQTAKRLKVLPLFLVRGALYIATANPQDILTLNEIEDRVQCTVHPVLARSENILEFIEDAGGDFDLANEMIGDGFGEIDEDFEVVDNLLPDDYSTIDEMAAGSPIVNLVNSLIQRAIRDGASDIHIEPGRKKGMVRFRIDGLLYEVMSPRIELHPAIVSRLKVMANLDIAERRIPQDGRIQVYTRQRSVDLRFSSLPGLYGEKVVLRVLDKNQAILDVQKLGLSAANLATYLDLLKRSHGLILVTGPTGSGKTTSLYAALNNINSVEKNIVTIEDPVEYQVDIINQNEVREKIGLGFAKVLKHVLRQDPDIVMVGEIRERETASIAVQAALTGHLVLSTLHTNDSVGAITRMIDMGVEPYLLSSALIGVMAQRLVRTICPGCKTTYMAPPEIMQRFGWTEESVTLARGRGCSECYDSGYKGRIAIQELLKVEGGLQNLIMSNPSRDQLTGYMDTHSMKTLFSDGLDRVRAQQTTIEEVARVITT
jgi:type IV pilus assembly protein PilB